MLYVERDHFGNIIGIHSFPTPQAQERKRKLDREVMEFLNSTGVSEHFGSILREFDLNTIRVLDDLINLLVDKNIIMFTELPFETQEKIKCRKLIRKKIYSDNFMVDNIL